MIRWLVSLAAAAVTVVSACSANQTAPNHPARAHIAHYLDRLSALGFSGQVLVAEGDKVILNASYGLADREAHRRLSPGEPLALASLSKQFTAAAVLRLVDQGKLGLQDNIERHLPDVPADKVGITVHDLLTHTSGLPRDVIRREEISDRSSLLGLLYVKPLRAGSETGYHYSNAGYQLLAALVEEVSGTPFDEFVRAELFEPLGLEHTGPVHTAEGAAAAVRAYNEWTDAGTWSDWPGGWKHRGSGGQVSTASDLFSWWRALKKGEVLSDSLVGRMFAPHTKIRENTFYGYGWELRTDSAQGDMVLHGGDNLGFHSELRWRARGDHLVIVLTNLSLYDESGGWLGLHKRRMASNLLHLMAGDSTLNVPEVQRVNPAEMHAIMGSYELTPGDRVDIWAASDVLWLGARGQGAVERFLPTDSAEAARRMKWNTTSRAVLECARTSDKARIATLLKPGEVDFFWNGLRKDWQSFESDHGPYQAMTVLGSVPLPWDPALVRTQIELVFGADTLDYHFTWSGDDLYEIISELGRPYPVMVPLARLSGSDTMVTFDHVTEFSVPMVFQTPAQGKFTRLMLDGRQATRR